jgi:hypothetical protein
MKNDMTLPDYFPGFSPVPTAKLFPMYGYFAQGRKWVVDVTFRVAAGSITKDSGMDSTIVREFTSEAKARQWSEALNLRVWMYVHDCAKYTENGVCGVCQKRAAA